MRKRILVVAIILILLPAAFAAEGLQLRSGGAVAVDRT